MPLGTGIPPIVLPNAEQSSFVLLDVAAVDGIAGLTIGCAAAGWKEWWKTFETGAHNVSDRLIELAEIKPGQKVLDIATGIGEPAVTAARKLVAVAYGSGNKDNNNNKHRYNRW